MLVSVYVTSEELSSAEADESEEASAGAVSEGVASVETVSAAATPSSDAWLPAAAACASLCAVLSDSSATVIPELYAVLA